MIKTIQESVAERISACGQTVQNTVVDKLAEVEIQKRVEIIIKAIQKQEALEKDLKKINKCDNATYVDGERKESMTEARFNEIKKTKEQLENIKKLIADCLEKNESELYNKLNGQIGGNKSENKGEDKSAS